MDFETIAYVVLFVVACVGWLWSDREREQEKEKNHKAYIEGHEQGYRSGYSDAVLLNGFKKEETV